MSKIIIPLERIEKKIYLIRNHKVMLDFDLAELYQVPTKRLKEQVKRNIARFPDDFMFQLTLEEAKILRSQIATSSWGGPRYLPHAFTEQGIAMLSSVLNSERAIAVNIAIIRAFVQLRQLMATHHDLAKKINDLDRQYKDHDQKIVMIYEAIRKLMTPSPPSEPKKGKIGFYKE
ncbi:MAG: ORF6N domain-containing protein [Candidatus Omnitrophica bacterium]|nr:ORF6N domain-containing protein [Candidatus Omnitrophota bacterium]